ncbi:MAG: sigma-70 family RNA polymerase sigma factor [Saprospiraceae bacterium]
MQTNPDWKNQLQALHRESYLWSVSCCNGDKEMAKDVLQTVYLKIYDEKAIFNEKSKLITWLFAIIKFTSIDFIRRNNLRVVNRNESQEFSAEEVYEKDKESWFKKILQGLPKQQREVLMLAFYNDLTLAEIAPLLNISIGTVRTHYERGKENFRKQLLHYKLDIELL